MSHVRLRKGPGIPPLFESVRTHQLSCLEARNNVLVLPQTPLAIPACRLRLACILTCVRRTFPGCTGPPEAVPSLLIIPHSSRVAPVLCIGATRLRDNCEPSYVHCHEQAHFRGCA